ncbi:hypothetical protein [Micromonospora sp. NPDC049204]|uniref:hypothetical protein n=1 Tax=Micromonospora sp. NPDC049204 TaxID=3154351 RepID=UPI0033DCC390
MITRCQQRYGRRASLARIAAVVSVLLLATTPVPGCAIRPRCQLYADNVHQLTDQLLHDGATAEDLDRFAKLMADLTT